MTWAWPTLRQWCGGQEPRHWCQLRPRVEEKSRLPCAHPHRSWEFQQLQSVRLYEVPRLLAGLRERLCYPLPAWDSAGCQGGQVSGSWRLSGQGRHPRQTFRSQGQSCGSCQRLRNWLNWELDWLVTYCGQFLEGPSLVGLDGLEEALGSCFSGDPVLRGAFFFSNRAAWPTVELKLR